MSAWMTRSQRRIVLRILVAFLPLFVAATGGCKPPTAQPWPFWQKYAARFISADGRVIDPSRGGITTSEGQSYAMFFALVNNDRAQFDKLLAWTQANLAYGDLGQYLPGWQWGKAQDGTWKLLDKGAASDSDCWIAYSLIEAGRLWDSDQYTQLGRAVMRHIALNEVENLAGYGLMLMPGRRADFTHGQSYTLNPSYVPHFLFARFTEVDPGGPWSAIAVNIPRLLKYSTRGGYAMDWVTFTPGKATEPSKAFEPAAGPSPVQPGQTLPAAVGSYDAIRVYLWAGMENSSGATRSDLLALLPGMASYLTKHGAPPEKVGADGMPIPGDGPVGFSAAVLPYLRALPQMDKSAIQQQQRIDAQLDPATGLYGKDPAYYNQNLILFAYGFQEKRFSFGPNGNLKVQWAP
jgi:endo-1,4-beta-D-glucanase Y